LRGHQFDRYCMNCRICRVRIIVCPKKLAPCILSDEVGPGCHGRKMFVPCWSLGGRYRHLTGPAGVGLSLSMQVYHVT
jgi:hypothetical protein